MATTKALELAQLADGITVNANGDITTIDTVSTLDVSGDISTSTLSATTSATAPFFNANTIATGYQLNGTTVLNYSGGNVVLGDLGAGVILHYSGSNKLATTSTGISVTGDAVISGDLTVSGNTVTLNTSTLTVEDLNITLASGAADAAAADGAGITVDGASATILYDNTNDLWKFNKGVRTDVGFTVATAAPSFVLMDATGTYNHKFRLNGSNSLIIERYDGTSTLSTLKLDETGDVGFYENNSGAPQVGMHWDYADGRLGIGTTSPNNTLHVKGPNQSGYGTMTIEGDGDEVDPRLSFYGFSTTASTTRNYTLDIFSDVSEKGARYDVPTGYYQSWTIQGSKKMLLDENGNLGIGESDPDTILHVKKNQSSAASSIKLENSAGGDDSSFDIDWQLASSGTSARIRAIRTNDPGAGDTDLVFSTSDNGTSLSDRLIIKHDGAVGIGPDSPTAMLHVQNIYDVTSSTDYAGIKLSRVAGATQDWLISSGVSGVSNSYFAIRDVTAGEYRLSIDTSGGVGIGTTSVSSGTKLEVEGEASGNWITIIKNTHNSNGSGLKVLAGDDADTTSFRVSTHDNNTLFDVRSDGEVTATRAYKTNLVRHDATPSLSLDFANATQLDSRITFTRDSIATYYDSKGILRYANVNEPRFDHDPETGISKGLLIEAQVANIFDYSNNPEKWSLVSAGSSDPIVNNRKSPDGTFNATSLIVTGGDPYFYKNNITLNGTYTFSYWIKAFGNAVGKHYSTRIVNISSNVFESDTLPSEWTKKTFTFTTTSTTNAYCGVEAPDNSPADGDEVSIWGAQLELGAYATSYIPSDTRFTSRTSRASYYDENGVIRFAGIDEPRYGYQYDGRKWVPTGLILEGSATNTVAYSDFQQGWAFPNAGYDYGTEVTAPDGSIIRAVTKNSTYQLIRQSNAFDNTVAKTVTLSFWAKTLSSVGTELVAWDFGDMPGGSVSVASADPLTSEWKRFSFVTSWTANQTVHNFLDITLSDNTEVAIWGVQVEDGEVATSYIETYDNDVTRSADVSSSSSYTRRRDTADINKEYIYDFYGYPYPDETTVFVEFDMISDITNDGTRYPLQLSGADTNDANENILFYVAGSDLIIARVRADGGTNVIQDTSTVTLVEDQFSKVAVSLKPGEQYFAQDGTLQHSGTSTSTLPAINAMRLGGWVHGNYRLNGHVKKVAIYNTALTSSELTALTEND